MDKLLKLTFSPSKNDLVFSLEFTGFVVVGYAFELRDVSYTNLIWTNPVSGSNADDTSDSFGLPLSQLKQGGWIHAVFSLDAQDIEISPNFSIITTLSQEGKIISQDDVSGKIVDTVTLYIQLIPIV